MLEEDYRSRLKDKDLIQTILPVFNFFEPDISKKIEKKFDEKYFFEYTQSLIKSNMQENISALRKKAREKDYSTLNSFVSSLQINTTQFINHEKYRTTTKFKKILYSYINVSRLALDIDKIEDIRKGIDQETKVFLSLSLIDMENDDVKANEEVKNISHIIESNPDYLLIPIHGCSTNIFRSIFDNFSSIDILHIAGHTSTSNNKTLLQFVDSNMTFTKFNEIIQYHQFSLAFLNCCSTLEFSNNSNIPNALNSVLHSDKVTKTHAYDFSEHFFITFNTTNNIRSSWVYATQNSNEIPLKYWLF